MYVLQQTCYLASYRTPAIILRSLTHFVFPFLLDVQICAFCYIGNKVLYDAIEACRDLPVRFDVEFRPFTLLCSTSPYLDKKPSRKEYLCKKLGDQYEAKWKVVYEMAQKAGLELSVFLFASWTLLALTGITLGPKMVSCVDRAWHIGLLSRHTRSEVKICNVTSMISSSMPRLRRAATLAMLTSSSIQP